MFWKSITSEISCEFHFKQIIHETSLRCRRKVLGIDFQLKSRYDGTFESSFIQIHFPQNQFTPFFYLQNNCHPQNRPDSILQLFNLPKAFNKSPRLQNFPLRSGNADDKFFFIENIFLCELKAGSFSAAIRSAS